MGWRPGLITVLSGGAGGSRFLQGLLRVVEPEDVTVVVNTGDDDEFFGLSVSFLAAVGAHSSFWC
jgi:LPPG:FO 2-phospho-L-lactate transferase